MDTSTLLDSWLRLWNGDYGVAPGLVTEHFPVHAALAGGGSGEDVSSPEGLVGWIQQARGAVPDMRFTVELGPIAQDDLFVVRWRAVGHSAGGADVDFSGTDILRVEGDRLAEYWVNSDIHVLMAQLGAGAAE